MPWLSGEMSCLEKDMGHWSFRIYGGSIRTYGCSMRRNCGALGRWWGDSFRTYGGSMGGCGCSMRRYCGTLGKCGDSFWSNGGSMGRCGCSIVRGPNELTVYYCNKFQEREGHITLKIWFFFLFWKVKFFNQLTLSLVLWFLRKFFM